MRVLAPKVRPSSWLFIQSLGREAEQCCRYVYRYITLASFGLQNIFPPDIFENLSLSVKKEKYRSPPDTLGEREPPSEMVEVAEKQTNLYEVLL